MYLYYELGRSMSCRIDGADLGQQSPGHHLIDTFCPKLGDASSLQKVDGACGHAIAEDLIAGEFVEL